MSKRLKRTFSQEERDVVFDLWKQGADFSDIARVIDAKPGSIFTILREHGGIKLEKRKRRSNHLTLLSV
jgi:transposase-like protein